MHSKTRQLTRAALGVALVCVATSIIKFPIPLGYAHLGNCMILLFGVYCDPWVGAFAGGVGSALSDLLGYPEWAIPTLIIKTLMGLGVALLAKKRGEAPRLRACRTFLAVLVGIVIMVLGYLREGLSSMALLLPGQPRFPALPQRVWWGFCCFT